VDHLLGRGEREKENEPVALLEARTHGFTVRDILTDHDVIDRAELQEEPPQ
jgi:hypothetical protein